LNQPPNKSEKTQTIEQEIRVCHSPLALSLIIVITAKQTSNFCSISVVLDGQLDEIFAMELIFSTFSCLDFFHFLLQHDYKGKDRERDGAIVRRINVRS
jgi:hypothetical protein